jgi:hypothetical protein
MAGVGNKPYSSFAVVRTRQLRQNQYTRHHRIPRNTSMSDDKHKTPPFVSDNHGSIK